MPHFYRKQKSLRPLLSNFKLMGMHFHNKADEEHLNWGITGYSILCLCDVVLGQKNKQNLKKNTVLPV